MRPSVHGRAAGFTLIELLVVMAIVALLLTVALPRYFGSLAQARDTALRENLKVLRVSLDKYAGDTGHFPATLEDLVSARYLRAVPLDPLTESAQTWVLEEADSGEVRGIVDVHSGAPGADREGVPYADY